MRTWLDRISLRVKMALIVLAASATALLTAATVIIVQNNRLILSRNRHQINSTANSLAVACELPLAVGDEKELSRLIQGFFSEEVLFIAAYDKNDNLVASDAKDQAAWEAYCRSGEENERFLLGGETVKLCESGGEFGIFSEKESTRASNHDTLTPSRKDTRFQVIGRVVMGHSTDKMLATQRSQMWMTLVVVMLAVVISSAIIFWGAKSWIRRLSRLVTASERISLGDFTQSIQDSSGDEVGRLSQAYEQMRKAVQQRTDELIEANERLRQTQADLVQSEKLSMLGQLAAGIAHEINTPIGAILNVAVDVQEHLQELFMVGLRSRNLPEEAIQWLTEITPRIFSGRRAVSEASARTERRQIERDLRKAGFTDYKRMAEVIVSYGFNKDGTDDSIVKHLATEPILSLLEHISALELFAEISLGSAKKVARIVSALRYYARTRHEESIEVNINESLDNTLVILQNRIKHIAQIKMNFCENLPRVWSGPDLSQVWTNILNNACDAIEEAHQGEMGHIEVSTRLDDNHIVVEISNDGPPIFEDNVQKIYDPFFTTKPIGKGTGLGLSICTGILRRCGGTVSARNEAGRVTFEVSLPISQNCPKAEEFHQKVPAEKVAWPGG
ncbi:MAG: ATP-binding protein [Planctomycetota bacterium]|nr:ATP-binding protein [Planctomycetota bacterium]